MNRQKNQVGIPCKAIVSMNENKLEMVGEKRVVSAMETGQVWAYPNVSDGGFPRSYARIDRIFPLAIPYLVQVTPLIPYKFLDEEKQFAELGLSLACGIFKASENTTIKEIATFTHEAAFEVGVAGHGRCFYKIFPKKGEIWAVYWNSQYKLVEIISDFTEQERVHVFALVTVAGLNGVYQRQVHDGFYMIRCFSRRFMPMFSHRVPASKIEESVEKRWRVMFH